MVVTDNASGDDSVERLIAAVREDGWGDWATIQPLERNGGYAFGNNAAIRPALEGADPPRYVLLLNPDTIVRPGRCRRSLSSWTANPVSASPAAAWRSPTGRPSIRRSASPRCWASSIGGANFGPVSRLLRRWVVVPAHPRGPRADRLGGRGKHDHPK